ncbi:hypothetical protein, variant 1 [Aphanomyces astaci]|uniref:Uncharacterized protein n=1 Tax=Aphanomyces astaci TaxID=112090 RepID=W4FSD6_APHAT|nr:hypothetical protein, variant 1 [Aphanomyces astaci]ETV70425.1 hypothetical protein, variant 1 [Aphanomyces astaci]|eukprot:XP_009840137.1 hypothetical protein, variant 1 [Aphanomyces astaci]
MHTPVVFYMRPLLWDDLRRRVNQAEIHELHQVLGHHLIDDNEALHAELKAFVDILDDYQKENDRIRDAVLSRPALPEPPSRMLLLDQLKLLASNLHERQLATPQDRALLGYVLSATPDSDVQNNGGNLTPRLKDCASFSSFNGNGVILRPGTADGSRRRSGTSSRPPSSRGLSSRGSVSSTASAPAMLEDLGCVSIRQIDSMKARLREALLDEKQQLLDDIEFIQGCVDMEQDLIEEDTKKVNVLVPPLKDLQEFRRTLEQVCLDKDKYDHVQERITKAEEMVAAQQRRKSISIDPLDVRSAYSPTPPRRSSTKAHKVRELVQSARDEHFFT